MKILGTLNLSRSTFLIFIHNVILWNYSVESAKIFFMIPLTTKSEKQPLFPFIDALGQRGHQVTVASIIKSNYSTPNVAEFTTIEYEEFLRDELFADPIEVRRNAGKYYTLGMNMDFANDACHKVYQNKQFQHAIQQKYDVVITNANFQECFLGALYKMETPFIIFSSMLPLQYIWELAGAAIPASFVPFAIGPPKPVGKMSLWERLENVLLDLHLTGMMKNIFIPDADRVAQTYLGDGIPSGYEIFKNFSLIFTNTHYTYNIPAPALPNIIEVGGMHCRPAKPLQKDLADFLGGAKDGFIYFSMGTIIKSQYFPEEMKKSILRTFSRLKQRVIWKFEEDLEDLPPNVKISKWLSQQDILGHPNIKMFITHGGAMSTYEAIYHGVPLIALPIFIDQNINARIAAEREFAITLEVLSLSEDTFGGTIQEILNNPKYMKNAKEMSSLLRDQPETPVERAVFWTEYVIRHKGASQMRSSARDLNFIEYYFLDANAIIVITLCILCFLIFRIVWSICRQLRERENLVSDKKKRKRQLKKE